LDEVLGLIFLAVYIVGVVSLAAAVTFAVIKIFPTERTPKKDDKPEKTSENGSGEGQGRLFRRSKRGESGARESEPPNDPSS
jgi:hypothetical protein